MKSALSLHKLLGFFFQNLSPSLILHDVNCDDAANGCTLKHFESFDFLVKILNEEIL